MNTKPPPILRVLLGMFFVASGLAKAMDTHTFVIVTKRYILEEVAFLAVAIPPVEFIVGLLLMTGLRVRQTARFAFNLTLLFTTIYTVGLLRWGITDCGCFGQIEFMKLPPWGMYIRNVIILGVCKWLELTTPHTITAHPFLCPAIRIRLALITVMGAAAFLLAGASYNGALFSDSVAVRQWSGWPLHKTPFAGLGLSSDSVYGLYLFRPDCTLCKDMTANAASWQEAGVVDEVIAITASGHQSATDSTYRMQYSRYFGRIVYLSNSQMAAAVEYVPTLIIVANDTVQHVRTGNIPTGFRVRGPRTLTEN